MPLGSLLTSSVTKLDEFVMGELRDRIRREIGVSTHPSECLVAQISPLQPGCYAAATSVDFGFSGMLWTGFVHTLIMGVECILSACTKLIRYRKG
jgi:hypothetical protein